MKRITWDEYFLTLAFITSLRSPDEETRHGCIIVSKDNRVLATGYNGFPRDIPQYYQKDLPTKRPDKYSFICHAERNSLANCYTKLDNAKAYVTGEPCNDCLMALWQHGVIQVYFDNKYRCNPNASNYSSNLEVRQKFLKYTGMICQPVGWVDYSFINKDTFQTSQNPNNSSNKQKTIGNELSKEIAYKTLNYHKGKDTVIFTDASFPEPEINQDSKLL